MSIRFNRQQIATSPVNSGRGTNPYFVSKKSSKANPTSNSFQQQSDNNVYRWGFGPQR